METKHFMLDAYGSQHDITLKCDAYCADNSLAITMTCYDEGWPEPWDVLTTNLGVPVPENHAFVQSDKYVDWVVKNGIGEKTDIFERSGFNVYELIKFNLEAIA